MYISIHVYIYLSLTDTDCDRGVVDLCLRVVFFALSRAAGGQTFASDAPAVLLLRPRGVPRV
jgi:hypothetical protein